MPSNAQVLLTSAPSKRPPLPMIVLIPVKLPVMSNSPPLKPSPVDPNRVTSLIRSPCSTSAVLRGSPSPEMLPVRTASMSNTSLPSPPSKLNALALVTLNRSAIEPPCRLLKPVKPKEFVGSE